MRGLGFRVRVVGRVLRLRNLGPCYERYGPQAPPAAAARRLARLQHAVRRVTEEIPQELMSRRILCRRTSACVGSWRLQRAGPRRCWSCRGHASRSAAAHQVRLAAVPPWRCLRGVRPPEIPPKGRAQANAAGVGIVVRRPFGKPKRESRLHFSILRVNPVLCLEVLTARPRLLESLPAGILAPVQAASSSRVTTALVP